jgi:hypothetical protein
VGQPTAVYDAHEAVPGRETAATAAASAAGEATAVAGYAAMQRAVRVTFCRAGVVLPPAHHEEEAR